MEGRGRHGSSWPRQADAVQPSEEGMTRVESDPEPRPTARPHADSSGVLDIGGLMAALPSEAFCISESAAEKRACDKSKGFTFARLVRASIVLKAEVSPGRACAGASADVYVKASDEQAEATFLGVSVGVGMFDLSRAIAQCGFLPGPCLLLGMAAVYSFLCHRLIEVPRLLNQNIETYGGIALVCFNKTAWRIAVLLVASSWFGGCTITLTSMLSDMQAVFCATEDCIGRVTKLLMSLCLLLLIFLTSAKDLRRFSLISLSCMGIIMAIEMVSAVWHGLYAWGSLSYTIVGHDLKAGVQSMIYSFQGIGVLPYIVSEMLQPQHAGQVVSRACAKQAAFCVAVGLVCYFGWGDEIKARRPIQELWSLSKNSWLCYLGWLVTQTLVVVKTIATFPLYFWPLTREIDECLGLGRRPAVELGLPWAIAQARRHKRAVRVVLLLLAVVPAFLQDTKPWRDFVIAVPLNLVAFCLPSVFAVAAIFLHLRMHRQAALDPGRNSVIDGQRTEHATVMGSNQSVAATECPSEAHLHYICGNAKAHALATCLVATVACAMSLWISAEWAWWAGRA